MLSSWDVSQLSKLLNLLQIVNDLHFLVTAQKLQTSLQSSLCVPDNKIQFTSIRYDMWKRLTGLSGHSWVFSACLRYQDRRVGGGTAWHSRTRIDFETNRGAFSLWDVYLVAWGDWTWVSLHSNLTVCKEGCSPTPCLLCKKQSCLTCKRVKPGLQTWFRFSGGAEPARPQDQKGHPSLIYCLYPISAHLFPQQMLWADFMLYLMAQGFTSPVCCL